MKITIETKGESLTLLHSGYKGVTRGELESVITQIELWNTGSKEDTTIKFDNDTH